MRRLLTVLVVVPSLVVVLASCARAGASAMTNPGQAPTSPTVTAIAAPTSDFSGIGTLDDGRPATECISANPRPDCDSASKADGRTLVLLGILLVALTGIASVVVRSTRRTNRARAEEAALASGRRDAGS